MKRMLLLTLCLAHVLISCDAEPRLSEPQMEAWIFSSREELEQAAAEGELGDLDHYWVPTAYQHLPVDEIRVEEGYVTVRYLIGDPAGTVYEGVEAEEAELLSTTVTFVWHRGDGEKLLKGYIRSAGLVEVDDSVYVVDLTCLSMSDTVLAREYYWLGENGELFQMDLPVHEIEGFGGSSEWRYVTRVDIS